MVRGYTPLESPFAHKQWEINRKSLAPKVPQTNFAWIILELGLPSCGATPLPPGGNRHNIGGEISRGGHRLPL